MPIKQQLSNLTHLGEAAFEKLNVPTATASSVMHLLDISKEFLAEAVEKLDIEPKNGPYSVADQLAISALKKGYHAIKHNNSET